MKKLILLFCFSIFSFCPSFGQGIWTWMAGSNLSGASASYGTQGVPSTGNYPGAAYSCFCWTDLNGNFWLYGAGAGIDYADMWKFDPLTLEWTWMNGSGQTSVTAVYGTMGIPSVDNTPGSRSLTGCTWIDNNGDLWLYGGSASGSYLGDLWRYNIASNEWTWMAGSNTGSASPVYGTKGVASASNTPGSRYEIGNSWVDTNGKLWLFGGALGYNIGYSDVWMFDPQTNMWTWESGSQTTGLSAIYGTKGVFAPGNTPGARYPYSMWTDNNDNLWLFGGGTYSNSQSDLWEYNISLNQWAWISGIQSVDATGVGGTLCQADSTFYPDGRFENRAAWKDRNGNFWMFGGGRESALSTVFGDVWEYLVDCNKWVRRSSGSFLNYGTEGVASASNQTGGRAGSSHWQDKQGAFWIYGGYSGGYLSDLWRYVPDSSCLTGSSGIITVLKDTVCSGSPAQLTITGASGAIQWQTSTDGTNFTNIAGATSMSYSSAALTQPTYFRVLSNGSCGNGSSVKKLVNVSSGSIAAGTIAAVPDSVCSGGSTQLTVSGSNGAIHWQSSANGISFTNIPGATSITYNAQNLLQNTYYRVTASNGCGTDSSSVKLINVSTLFAIGNISAVPDNVCRGNSSLLTVTGGGASIQWQSSTNGVSFSDISSANAPTYNTPGLNQTTYYRIRSSNSCGPDSSAVKMISIIPTPVAGIVKGNPDSVCSGSFSQLTVNGGAGNIQWQSSPDGLAFLNIPGASSSVYTTPNLSKPGYFRVIDSNGCGSDSSAAVEIYISPLPVAGTLTSNRDSICLGTGVTSRLTYNGAVTGLIWQSSTDKIHFSVIPGQTSATYTTPRSLGQTTTYFVVINNNCGSDSSNLVTVHIVPAPSVRFSYTTNGKQISFKADSATSNVISYSWDFGDNQTIKEINPTHNFDSVKTYYVCLTVFNGSNCSYTYCQYVSTLNTGIETVQDNQFIQLHPNPAGNILNLSVNGLQGNYRLKIYNVLGQQIKAIPELFLQGNESVPIDLSGMIPGTYELILMNDKEYFSERFVHLK